MDKVSFVCSNYRQDHYKNLPTHRQHHEIPRNPIEVAESPIRTYNEKGFFGTLKKAVLSISLMIGCFASSNCYGQSMGATSISNGSITDPLNFNAKTLKHKQFQNINSGLSSQFKKFAPPMPSAAMPSFTVQQNTANMIKSRGLPKNSSSFGFNFSN